LSVSTIPDLGTRGGRFQDQPPDGEQVVLDITGPGGEYRLDPGIHEGVPPPPHSHSIVSDTVTSFGRRRSGEDDTGWQVSVLLGDITEVKRLKKDDPRALHSIVYAILITGFQVFN
jgi:hypothetical protein